MTEEQKAAKPAGRFLAGRCERGAKVLNDHLLMESYAEARRLAAELQANATDLLKQIELLTRQPS